jgi:proteasome lid subunit RPN8/RPN11
LIVAKKVAVHIPIEVRSQIEAHARDTYPEECCGILLGTFGGVGVVRQMVRAENTADAETRAKRYLIDPRAILEADKIGRAADLEIVGFYHSHPDHPAVPSQTDLSQAWPDYVYVIVERRNDGPGELRAWQLTEDRAMSEIPIR